MNKIIFSIIFTFLFINNSFADQIRMAYLEVKEVQKNNFDIIFKSPLKFNRKLDIKPEFPQECHKTSISKNQFVNKAYLSTFKIECTNGLLGQTIYVNGLKQIKTDLLLKLDLLDSNAQTVLISKDKNSYTIAKQPSAWQVSKTYTLLGIEHILHGFDHLLFVLSLLLIVKNFRTLVWTITAFTLAHSITLAGVTFGYLKLPQQPVEAVIALSIMFLAMEVLHKQRGINGIASKFPWIVSFTFGLLHGFGFAGALAEIGLPEQSVPLALLFFNVGVESGQLMFVSVVISLGFIIKKLLQTKQLNIAKTIMVYGIGSMASFWFVERVSAF